MGNELFVDGSTAIQASNMNKVLVGDQEGSGYYSVLAYRIAWGGASFSASATIGAIGSYGNPVILWDATDNKCTIDLSGLTKPFTSSPAVIVSAEAGSTHASGSRYIPSARSTSATDVEVRFIDPEDANIGSGSLTFVTSTSTKMVFHIILFGSID